MRNPTPRIPARTDPNPNQAEPHGDSVPSLARVCRPYVARVARGTRVRHRHREWPLNRRSHAHATHHALHAGPTSKERNGVVRMVIAEVPRLRLDLRPRPRTLLEPKE